MSATYESGRWRGYGLLIAASFLLLNGYVVFAWLDPSGRVWGGERKATVAILGQYGSENGGGQRGDLEPLRLLFDRKVFAVARVNEVIDEHRPVLEPDHPGTWVIDSPRVLRFTPLAPWRVAQFYRVRLDRRFLDLEGIPIAAHAMEFTTAGPQLTKVWTAELGEEELELNLRFDQAVDPEVVPEYLVISDGLKGRTLEILRQAAADENPEVVRVWLALPPELRPAGRRAGVTLSVRQEEGLVGLAGPVPGRGVSKSLELVSGAHVQECEGLQNGLDKMRIAVRFSSRVVAAAIGHHLAIQPEVPFRCVSTWRGVELVGDFEAGQTYRLTFARGLPLNGGQALLRDEKRVLVMPDYREDMEFRGSGTLLAGVGRRALDLEVVNCAEVDLEAFRLFPNNLVHHLHEPAEWRFRQYHGQAVASQTIRPAAPHNERTTLVVALDELLGAAATQAPRGTYLIRASGTSWSARTSRLVTLTELGITCKSSPSDLLVWVTSTTTGQPLGEVEVAVLSSRNQELVHGRTDERGLVHFRGFTPDPGDPPAVVTAQAGEDLVFLEYENGHPVLPGSDVGRSWKRGDDVFVFGDRGVTRPGEALRIGGWLRDPLGRGTPTYPLELVALRPDGRTMWKQAVPVQGNGWFEARLPVGENARTGRWTLDVRVPGGGALLGRTDFLVEEFRPDRLRVRATLAEDRLAPRDEVAVALHAEHTTGTPAAGLRASAQIHYRPTRFVPEGFEDYRFEPADPDQETPRASIDLPEVLLDENGEALVPLDLSSLAGGKVPWGLDIICSVHEPGGRAVSATARATVFPRPDCTGLRISAPEDPRKGDELVLQVAAVTPGGLPSEAEQATVTVRRIHTFWTFKTDRNGDSRYVRVEDSVHVADLAVPLTAGRGSCVVPGEHVEGQLRFIARTGGGEGALDLNLWGDTRSRPDRVQMAFDAREGFVGETLTLQIRSPFAGLGLLTLEQDEVVESRLIEVPEGLLELPFTLRREHVPTVHAALSVVRKVAPGRRQFRAAGRASLAIRDGITPLLVRVEAPAEGEPGQTAQITLRLQDADGQAHVGEVVCYAVDESVLALTRYSTPDPQEHYEGLRRAVVECRDVFGRIIPEPGEGEANVRGTSGGDGGLEAAYARLLHRPQREGVCALWLGMRRTDDMGRVRFETSLPEFQGQLRFMVLGTSGNRFARAEHAMTVRRPFEMTLALPSFLAPGDEVRLPLTLRCVDPRAAGQLDARVVVSGPLVLDGTVRLRDMWSEGEERTLWLSGRARRSSGPAVLTVAVRAGEAAASAEHRIVVRHAGPTIAECGALKVDEPRRMPRIDDLEVLRRRSYIEASCAPWAGLEQALDGLVRYPYGCLEQTVSRAFPLLGITELSRAGIIDPLWEERAGPLLQAAFEKLRSFRLAGGGLSLWPDLARAYPWGSLYALCFLDAARERGYAVPQDLLTDLLAYAEACVAHSASDLTRCYGLYLLARNGKPARAWAERMLERGADLDIEARYLLAGALHAMGDQRAWELIPADPPVPRGIYERGGTLRSDVRLFALALDITRQLDPQSPHVSELLLRLCKHVRTGKLYNTQATAFTLHALCGVLAQMPPGEKPSATLRIHLVDGSVRELRIPENGTARISLAELGQEIVRLEKEGSPVYVAYTVRGVPLGERPREFDRGLRIERRWLRPDGSELEGALQAGDAVLVELKVQSEARVANTAWIDVLPAGFAIENPRFVTTAGGLPVMEDDELYEPQRVERLADRLLLFGDLSRGSSTYRYLIRATSPGRFVRPPAEVVCLYDEELKSVRGGGEVEVVQ